MLNKSLAAKSCGFTLLELLLVITIVGAMATVGIAFYRQHSENAKVTKTALQMQQILHAANSYFVEHHAWPMPRVGDDANCANLGDFVDYLPPGSTKSPWGNSYQCQHIAHSSLQEGRYPFPKFMVVTNLPSARVANLVAAKLPNASLDFSTVKAEIAIPGQQIGGNMLLRDIVTACYYSGDAYKDNNPIPLPNCPPKNDLRGPPWNCCARVKSDDADLGDDPVVANLRLAEFSCPIGYVGAVTGFSTWQRYAEGSWIGGNWAIGMRSVPTIVNSGDIGTDKCEHVGGNKYACHVDMYVNQWNDGVNNHGAHHNGWVTGIAATYLTYCKAGG